MKVEVCDRIKFHRRFIFRHPPSPPSVTPVHLFWGVIFTTMRDPWQSSWSFISIFDPWSRLLLFSRAFPTITLLDCAWCRILMGAPPPFLSSWPVDPQTNEQDSHFLHPIQCFSPWKLFYILHPYHFLNSMQYFSIENFLCFASNFSTTTLGDLLRQKSYFLTTTKT